MVNKKPSTQIPVEADLYRQRRNHPPIITFVVDTGVCLELDRTLSRGYPVVTLDNHTWRWHHLMWVIAYQQPVPAGFHLHHFCGNKRCGDPPHLTVLPASDHIALHHRRYHCTNGHRKPPGAPCPTCYEDLKASRRTGNPVGVQLTHHNTTKTHCPYGHPYTPDNTRITKQGARQCKTCMYLRQRRNKRSGRRNKLTWTPYGT